MAASSYRSGERCVGIGRRRPAIGSFQLRQTVTGIDSVTETHSRHQSSTYPTAGSFAILRITILAGAAEFNPVSMPPKIPKLSPEQLSESHSVHTATLSGDKLPESPALLALPSAEKLACVGSSPYAKAAHQESRYSSTTRLGSHDKIMLSRQWTCDADSLG